jgi:uncharacterized protein YkwD
VPAPRSLLTAIVSAACAVLVVSSAPAAPAPPLAASPALATLAFHARATAAKRTHAACAKGAARAHRATHCRSSTRSRHVRDTTKPRVTKIHQLSARTKRSHVPASPAPTSEPAGTTAQSGSQRDAATIAAVLASSCQNTELTPEAGNIQLVRAAVLCLINRKRAESGESPLVLNPELEQAAEGHCEELIADDYFAHVSPSGETPVDRIRNTGYIPNSSVGYVIGENLAWGTYQLSTPQSIVSAWFASPGHLANILEAQYRDTGIGVTPAVPSSLAPGAPGATYAQEFGVIIH